MEEQFLDACRCGDLYMLKTIMKEYELDMFVIPQAVYEATKHNQIRIVASLCSMGLYTNCEIREPTFYRKVWYPDRPEVFKDCVIDRARTLEDTAIYDFLSIMFPEYKNKQ